MTAYSAFSNLYESFMEDAPYEQWLAWLRQQFPNLRQMEIADVGCGTGRLTRMLAGTGARVVGIDLSEEMLGVAMQAAYVQRLRIDWLCQNMTELQLPRPANLVISSCDALNYLLGTVDVQQTFRSVWNNLEPGGWFCFDVVGAGRVERLREGLSYDIRSDAVALFESNVAANGEIRYELTAFALQPNGLYDRVSEEHIQRWYSIDWLGTALAGIGFEVQQRSGDFGHCAISNAQRVLFKAHKPVV